MVEQIEIRFVDSWADDEIVELYKVGGWWKESYDKSMINLMISGSFVFAVVIDSESEKTIGMGRVISDGVSDAYIQDLVIIPEYRGKGFGKKLVKSLIKYCCSKGLVWIGLIAEPGSEEFYRDLGLQLMKGHIPMLYHMEE